VTRRIAICAGVLALSLVGAGSAGAAFPGGNGRIAFQRAGDIWTANPDGSGELQLTASAGTNSEPAWSADGRRIAFVSDRDGNEEIYVMAGDGTGQSRVTNDPARDDFPSWSPDGHRIAFERGPGFPAEVYVVGSDGTGLVNLTNGEGGGDPDWSPDGQKIAFEYQNDILVMNTDGTGRTDLTNRPPPSDPSAWDGVDGPDWSPDGGRIAYHYTWGTRGFVNDEIRSINAGGTNDQYVPNTGVLGAGHPAFSPDGAIVAFSCGDICFTSDFDPLPTARSPDW